MSNVSLYEDLEFRGLIKQVTDPALKSRLNKPITLYCGFDPTSDSLHLGSLLPALTLKRFQEAGHKVIAVVGGATGMIGDPSGKTQERQLLTNEVLKKNIKGLEKSLSRFLSFSGPNAAIMANNNDWTKEVSYVDFLRDYGKHFTVNHMMAKESVRARLEDREHGISYTEFSYMLLQAFDFYQLYKDQKCTLQIGGSDQWGNITAGCELIRRICATEGKAPEQMHGEVYGLTWPLVMKRDGGKFGKSEQGNIWLDAEKTSPYQFYQFLVQTADDDVITFLKYFTFLSKQEIHALEQSVKTAPEKREAQKRLAEELTKLVHGEQELQKATQASDALFGTDIKNLDRQSLLQAFGDAPSTKKSKSALGAGFTLVDALVETGLCSSKGAARKDITAGGIYVNNERTNDATYLLKNNDLIAGCYILLRKGKKNYHLISFE